MTPFEMETALKSLTCIVDTREQDTKRFRARIKDIQMPIIREKLDFGDYSAKWIMGDKWVQLPVSIERKMSFEELTQCYCQNRKRFKAEFERAKQAGAKIYLLIENVSWEDAYNGRYQTRMKPQALIASLLAWLARYNCQVLMCSQSTTGKLINDILYREAKEIMEAMMDA